MGKNGKIQEVFIEDVCNTDERTGIRTLCRCITVYADKGLRKHFSEIPGITDVYNNDSFIYSIWLDPRYDREYVKKEIESVVMCNSEEE